jgi:hypothetical protein
MPDIQLTLKLTNEQFDKILGLVVASDISSITMSRGISHRKMSSRLYTCLEKAKLITDQDIMKFIALPTWRSELRKHKNLGSLSLIEFEDVYKDIIKIVENTCIDSAQEEAQLLKAVQ